MENNRSPGQQIYNAAKTGNVEEVKRLTALLDKDSLLNILNGLYKDPDPEIKNAGTALYVAAKEGHLDVVKFLLELGVNPNISTEVNFVSPLQAAVGNGHHDVVEALLKSNGVNPYQKNVLGQTIYRYVEDIEDEEQWKKVNNVLDKMVKEERPELDSMIKDENVLCPMEGSQGWQIAFMKALEYSDDYKGLCFGLANISAEFLLIDGGFSNLNKQFKEMYSIVMNAEYEARQKFRELPENERIKMTREDRKLFIQNNSTKIIKIIVANKENKIDIEALCDSIEVYQNIHKHKELLDKNIDHQSVSIANQLVETVNLEERGGKIGVYRCSGIYTLNELTDYYKLLRSYFNEKDFPHPVSLQLCCSGKKNHAITIGFDSEKQQWIYIDANKTPQYISDENELARIVMKAFFSKNPEKDLMGIQGCMYMAAYKNKEDFKNKHNSNIDKIIPLINKLKEDKKWKEIHSPDLANKEKIKRKDIHGSSWSELAAKNGEIEMTRQILKKERKFSIYKISDLRNLKGLAKTNAKEKYLLPVIIDVADIKNREKEKNIFGKWRNKFNFFKNDSIFGAKKNNRLDKTINEEANKNLSKKHK